LELERVPDESFRKILERLAGGGFLQNNRQFIVHVHWRLEGAEFNWARSSRFIEVICSMKNLESLYLLDHAWSSSHELCMKPEDLALVFQSCSKITDLRITTTEDGMSKMPEHVKNQLRSSFQKLRYFGFRCFIDNDSWPVIQEMLT
jgi:hypothetical protein